MNKSFAIKGDHNGIIVSSRARLARNLADFPFAGKMSPEHERQVINKVSDAIKNNPAIGSDFSQIDLQSAGENDIGILVERHLISPELANSKDRNSGALVSADGGVSIMLNEEDHVRLQVLGTGMCLDKCYENARRIDELIDESVSYAYDPALGYLTRCPTNLGTGLRASVMMHLPALSSTGLIGEMIAQAEKIRIAVRGFYGEGSKANGDYFQISNHFTLGITEEEIISRITNLAVSLCAEEEKCRRGLLKKPDAIHDRVWRAFGLLAYARRIDTAEAMSNLSAVRLAVSSGIIKNTDADELTEILYAIQPCSVAKSIREKASQADRDAARADILRARMAEIAARQ